MRDKWKAVEYGGHFRGEGLPREGLLKLGPGNKDLEANTRQE